MKLLVTGGGGFCPIALLASGNGAIGDNGAVVGVTNLRTRRYDRS